MEAEDKPRPQTVELRDDEVEWLKKTAFMSSDTRCGCGHLVALHNGHCCSFCMVPGCPCESSP